MFLLRRRPKRSAWKIVATFVTLSLGPLALLTFSSVELADDAVRREVESRVHTTAVVSARLVEIGMQGNVDLVVAYATRTLLVGALDEAGAAGPDLAVVNFQINELANSRPGVVGAFLTDPSCRLVAVRPETPTIVGKDFSFRDWCTGVRATGAPYVSEAYRTSIAGEQMVIAAAVPVRARDGAGEVLGYLCAIYDLESIQAFAEELAGAQHIGLTVVDKHGTVLADQAGGTDSGTLHSRLEDPLVAAALAGDSGVVETEVADVNVLAAYAPVDSLGWVVVAEVPAATALAGVTTLRSTVLRIAAVLCVVLLAAAYFLVRTLRQRHLAESSVRAGAAKMRGILDGASDGFVAMGADGTVTGWNVAATRLFGWTADEAIGRRLSELIIPPQDRATHDAALQRFRTADVSLIVGHRVELDGLRRDGSTFPVELKVSGVEEAGRWTFTAFIEDITERKQHEAELAHARDLALEGSRLKSEFLANMSHEIRTPMNGVIGMTSLLLETDLDVVQRDSAETVLRSGESLLAIINDILDFSKIEAGRLDLEVIEFGTQHLVEDVTALLALRADDKALELVTYVHPDVPAYVRGDPGRVRQVITNLVSNAIKFTARGQVVLEMSVDRAPAADDGGCVLRIDVVDTGIGVAPEHQLTIFDSFTQADSSTTRRYGGTGLGLAISQQLVQLMGGSIGVHSVVGQGSTFWFTVPVAAASQREPRPRRADLGGARVLIVDDNATNRLVLGRMVAGWGMVHTEVDGGRAALSALRQAADDGAPFDAALVDLHMPGIDGLALATEIKADPRVRDVALVLLTSSAQRGEAAKAQAAGIAAYLAKPAHSSQLHACLATVLGPSGSEAAPIVTRHQIADAVPRSGRILVAEDNPINQRVAVGMLESLGYTVDVVGNGREAVIAATATRFDLILMDCQMPVMDGFEATAVLRAGEDPGGRTPIVALTASAMQQDRQRCLDAGMDDHLAKPVRRDELAAVLTRFGRGASDVPSAFSPAQAEVAAHHGMPTTGDAKACIVARLDDLFEGLGDDTDADRSELLTSFLRRVALEMERVDAAVSDRDIAALRASAHSVKGMAGNVGASQVALAAAVVEEAARDGHIASGETTTLRGAVADVGEVIRGMIHLPIA